MSNEKVFCKNCMFINSSRVKQCKAPGNIITKCNFYEEYEYPERLPEHINKKNNCVWYQPYHKSEGAEWEILFTKPPKGGTGQSNLHN